MTCHIGENIIICDGQSGWRVEPALQCPWCDERRRCLRTWIHGGYSGFDAICGTCGSYWSWCDEISFRKLTDNERDENIARVAARPDPKCWDCHDTGDTGGPMDVEDSPCSCGAKA